jgi:tRNA threonylcarbamoyl adenosine modification protein YjeE
MELITKSDIETQKFGTNFAVRLKKGDVIVLEGSLGAGKTVMVKGIAKGLGIKKTITSPTYTISKTYSAICNNKPIKFNHIDAYRIKSIDDFENLGIDFDNSISVIEWGNNFVKLFTQSVYKIFIVRDFNNSYVKELSDYRKIIF